MLLLPLGSARVPVGNGMVLSLGIDGWIEATPKTLVLYNAGKSQCTFSGRTKQSYYIFRL